LLHASIAFSLDEKYSSGSAGIEKQPSMQLAVQACLKEKFSTLICPPHHGHNFKS